MFHLDIAGQQSCQTLLTRNREPWGCGANHPISFTNPSAACIFSLPHRPSVLPTSDPGEQPPAQQEDREPSLASWWCSGLARRLAGHQTCTAASQPLWHACKNMFPTDRTNKRALREQHDSFVIWGLEAELSAILFFFFNAIWHVWKHCPRTWNLYVKDFPLLLICASSSQCSPQSLR